MKKRILSLALVVLLALSLLPMGAFAAEGDFVIEDGFLDKYNGPGGDVVIPDGVTTISWNAFYGCTNLKSVTIPSSVTRIMEWAFSDCTNLETVTIPSSVTTIGDDAFYNTPWLKAQGDFAIANGVLFEYQGSATSVTIPSTVTKISGAFSYCSTMTSVTIPNSVKSIGTDAFSHCDSLRSVVIPDSVTSIEGGAFRACWILSSVTIPSSVTSISDWAFVGCSNLTDVYYGGSEAQWKAIGLDEAADALAEANIHYTACASTQNVLVDGKSVEFECYALKDASGNDTNYIKLRDVASVLNGTAAQFNVGWDGNVNIETGKAYAANGTEMSTPYSGNRTYENATAATNINGKAADLSAIVLKDDAGNGYTYYKLRDLGNALGFTVDWSAEKGIFIETK